MRGPITIGGITVEPGKRRTVDLRLARLYTHTELSIPLHIVHGKKPGPRLFVSAAIHGDEILGVEIIRRLLSLKALARLRGTLLAIPVVNVYGFLNLSRYSPDRRDLNRFFPGTEKGSLTSRLANLFMEQVVAPCSYGIDLHTGSNHRSNLPQIRAYLDDDETQRLANAFGAPIILDADLLPGSLRQAVHDRGVHILLYEAGEVLRFDEMAIRAGLKGVVSVMRAIGMLPQVKRKGNHIEPLVAKSSSWVRAPISGIVRSKIPLGTHVAKNAKLAEISDPFGEDHVEVLSPTAGVIIGKLNLPLVHQGDALVHVAVVESPVSATATISAFKQEFEPDL